MNKNLSNYHSHSLFCDGRAEMRDFVRFAVSSGFTSYGFSSHAPLPFSTPWAMEWDAMDDYLAEFRRMKKVYADRIQLYIGLEIDYLDEESNPAAQRFRQLPLDYRIGSVHLLHDDQGRVVDVDTTPEHFRELVDHHFGGNLDKVIALYYTRLLRMIELGGFDIVGHADKMHYNASCYRPGLLDEPWYDELVHDYLATIARKGYQVEINTKSFHETGTFFPNKRYFSYLQKLGVPVQVNSDAHYPQLINNNRPEALRALWQAGYRTVMELHNSHWQEVPILL